MRRLKRGNLKYKGKPPFKCFECGILGYYASKYPFGKGSDSDEEEIYKK